MAAKGGSIDFMFLAPSYPATGSATEGYRILARIAKIDEKLFKWILVKDSRPLMARKISEHSRPVRGREIQYPYRTKMTPNSAIEKRSIWRPCLTPSNQFLDPPLVCVSDQTKIVNYGPFIVLTTKVT